ncbi:MAG: hypothetical protein IJA60_02345 [Clostridia bacterium]|nr:hypothetical protein [Clostridia bacterium]
MKIFVMLSLTVALVMLFCIVLCPIDYLESEKRYVSEFSISEVAFCERLPFREQLMRLNRDVMLALGINEFSGAFFGKNGYIFSNETVSGDVLEKNLLSAKAFADKNGISTHIALIGSKTDVLVHFLPELYGDERKALWKCDGHVADILPMLILKGGEGKYIFYRGDHHLTSLGSYYVYKSLSNALGYDAYGASDFSVSVVKSDFSGSDARKMLTVTDDRIALFRYKGDSEYVTENLDTGKKYNGLYDYDKLFSPDPYGIFPIADCGRAKITLGEGREMLLLICDSYGDSLAPFLARHYDLDIVDPRYFGGSVKGLIDENDYAKVLFCFGMDTLASKEVLYKLNF